MAYYHSKRQQKVSRRDTNIAFLLHTTWIKIAFHNHFPLARMTSDHLMLCKCDVKENKHCFLIHILCSSSSGFSDNWVQTWVWNVVPHFKQYPSFESATVSQWNGHSTITTTSFVLPRQIFRWSELVTTIKEEIWRHTCVGWSISICLWDIYFLRKWQLSSAVSLGRTVLERTVWPKRYQVQNAIISSRSFPTVMCQKNTTNISRIGLATTFFWLLFTKKHITKLPCL